MTRLREDNVCKFIQSSDIIIPLLVLSLLCALEHTYVKLIAMKMCPRCCRYPKLFHYCPLY